MKCVLITLVGDLNELYPKLTMHSNDCQRTLATTGYDNGAHNYMTCGQKMKAKGQMATCICGANA